jgi:hypothetical protein
MRQDDLGGLGRHEEAGFRYSTAAVRPVFSGRDLLRRLGRVFVIGVLVSSGLFYGAKLLMNHHAEVALWVARYVNSHASVLPSEAPPRSAVVS